MPIGFRADPGLPESRLAEAIGLEDLNDERSGDGEVGLIGLDGLAEVVPGEAFGRLSRGAARRMAGVVDRASGPRRRR